MNSKFFHILIITAILCSFLIYSCDDTFVNSDIDSRVIPEQNISFSEHIYPVINSKCAFSGCHEDQTRAANLSVTTWSNFIADPLMIFPYYPGNSKVVWAIEGTGPVPMPPRIYPQLTINQREGIKKWIEEGAKNN